MSLTRKSMEAMGIEPEKIDQIMELHLGVVNEIKSGRDEAEAQAKKYKEEIEKLSGVQKELDDLKAGQEEALSYKKKYEDAVADLEKFKEEQATAKRKADTDAAAREYFKEKKITGDDNLEIVMRGAKDEIGSLELDEDGKIKDTKVLDDLVSGVFAKFVSTEGVQGATTATPPANNGGNTGTPSRAAQLAMQYRNEHYGTKED